MLTHADIMIVALDKLYQPTDIDPSSIIQLNAEDIYNNEGSWSLEIPASFHDAVKVLRSPGAQLKFQGPGWMRWSGPVTKWTAESTPQDGWVYKFEGVTEHIRLKSPILPNYTGSDNPNGAATLLDFAFQDYGNVGAIPMSWLILDNITAGRRGYSLNFRNGSSSRGTTTVNGKKYPTWSGKLNFNSDVPEIPNFMNLAPLYRRYRFDYALDVISKLLTTYNFHLMLNAIPKDMTDSIGGIAVDFRQVKDLSESVILDSSSGQVVGSRFGIESPTKTGQFLAGANSGATEYLWSWTNVTYGRMSETYEHDDEIKSNAVASGRINDNITDQEGFAPKGFGQFTLVGDQSVTGFGKSWYIGDVITIMDDVGTNEIVSVKARATGAVFAISKDGIQVGVRLGDDVQLDTRSLNIPVASLELVDPYDTYVQPTLSSAVWTNPAISVLKPLVEYRQRSQDTETLMLRLRVDRSQAVGAVGATQWRAKPTVSTSKIDLVRNGSQVSDVSLGMKIAYYNNSGANWVKSDAYYNFPAPNDQPQSITADSDWINVAGNPYIDVLVDEWPEGNHIAVLEDFKLSTTIQWRSPGRLLQGQYIGSYEEGAGDWVGGDLKSTSGVPAIVKTGNYPAGSRIAISRSGLNDPLWTSSFFGPSSGNSRLAMSAGGELLFIVDGTVVWRVGGGAGAYAEVTPDGSFDLYNAAGQSIWSSASKNRAINYNMLRAGQAANAGTYIVSPDQECRATTVEGTIWLLCPTQHRTGWNVYCTIGQTSGRDTNPNCHIEMRSTGALVINRNSGTDWTTNTSGSGNYCVLGDSGNFAVMSAGGNLLWQTGVMKASSGNTVVNS